MTPLELAQIHKTDITISLSELTELFEMPISNRAHTQLENTISHGKETIHHIENFITLLKEDALK